MTNGQNLVRRFSYTEYDGVGNVKTITDSDANKDQAFTYDALDRLATATSSQYGYQAFAYDVHGNRQSFNGATYTYPIGQPFKLTQLNGVTNLGYDANGNLTTANTALYAYTPNNQLEHTVVNGTTTAFAYDGDDMRVKKSVTGGNTWYYIRGADGQLLSEWKNTGAHAEVKDYIYAGSRLIAVGTTNQTPR